MGQRAAVPRSAAFSLDTSRGPKDKDERILPWPCGGLGDKATLSSGLAARLETPEAAAVIRRRLVKMIARRALEILREQP
jgi:hypothetical protein